MPSCLCTELGVDTYMFREYAITLGNELQKPIYIYSHFIYTLLQKFWGFGDGRGSRDFIHKAMNELICSRGNNHPWMLVQSRRKWMKKS